MSTWRATHQLPPSRMCAAGLRAGMASTSSRPCSQSRRQTCCTRCCSSTWRAKAAARQTSTTLFAQQSRTLHHQIGSGEQEITVSCACIIPPALTLCGLQHSSSKDCQLQLGWHAIFSLLCHFDVSSRCRCRRERFAAQHASSPPLPADKLPSVTQYLRRLAVAAAADADFVMPGPAAPADDASSDAMPKSTSGSSSAGSAAGSGVCELCGDFR